ncbi:MAG TPA: isoprenylcysteine carboxylmethyltransferase family protein [Geobacteraceae bacterium]|nr:isoprenylcysteine carboxylmethyltransferase family protein [Geobacteraceae bacterium]
MPSTPWWKNSRGELFVLCQSGLFALIIFGPPTLPQLPAWGESARLIGQIAGGLLLAAGFLLGVAGVVELGRNLTPFITPVSGSVLLERGAYRLVRHPIYSGLLQMAFGWGLWRGGWLTLAYALLLLILFDRKARREEQILLVTFPGYAAYSRRVRRLIPYVY